MPKKKMFTDQEQALGNLYEDFARTLAANAADTDMVSEFNRVKKSRSGE